MSFQKCIESLETYGHKENTKFIPGYILALQVQKVYFMSILEGKNDMFSESSNLPKCKRYCF